ncbi:hypothetical protein Bint_0539 [Brachyspira intermedia PWS/A]|uniref:Uncharacterized protein n=1 Tax=Brachyspira intermedia (strain ATCC 51140 / PWS/A) TaxID=1045858 RepID=G0EJH1_BRAIP|nr:hypothetical protein [Brachyspira intermedia]AEM21170.1 hypothetical protein Bint_0539 [Brachyspira intermedia PWS/A]
MNIIFDVTLGDIIGYIITIIGFGFVGVNINKKIDQSGSNVGGDQIGGNKKEVK